jgi:hypothetical protein
MRFPVFFLAIVAVWSQTGCNRRHSSDSQQRNVALVVCPNASGVHWLKSDATEQVTYRVRDEYPAYAVLSCISTELGHIGWQPMKEDFWNPGMSSSHVQGWAQFADASVQPQATVDQWTGQWTNAAGDIVWYVLRYRYPPDDRNHLVVAGGFISATVAEKLKRGSKVHN